MRKQWWLLALLAVVLVSCPGGGTPGGGSSDPAKYDTATFDTAKFEP